MSWYVNKTHFLDNLLISFSPFPKKKQEQKEEDNPPKVPIDDNDDNDDDDEFEFEEDEETESIRKKVTVTVYSEISRTRKIHRSLYIDIGTTILSSKGW